MRSPSQESQCLFHISGRSDITMMKAWCYHLPDTVQTLLLFHTRHVFRMRIAWYWILLISITVILISTLWNRRERWVTTMAARANGGFANTFPRKGPFLLYRIPSRDKQGNWRPRSQQTRHNVHWSWHSAPSRVVCPFVDDAGSNVAEKPAKLLGQVFTPCR